MNNIRHKLIKGSHAQEGSALIVSLILLLVMAIMGLAATQGSTLQTRMATHMRDRSMAFESAEAALRDSHDWLNTQFIVAGKPNAAANGATGVWTRFTPETQAALPYGRWDAGGWTARGRLYPIQGGMALPGVASQPRMVIEEWQFISDDIEGSALAQQRGLQNYRVTVRGEGGTADAAVLLQSMVRQRVN